MKIPAHHYWVLGYIDHHGSVQSVTAPAFAVHSDYFPRQTGRRWRVRIGDRDLVKIPPDRGMHKLYELTNEEEFLIQEHLVKKGYAKDVPEIGTKVGSLTVVSTN